MGEVTRKLPREKPQEAVTRLETVAAFAFFGSVLAAAFGTGWV